MSTPLPNSLANGRYELGQLIGRGGMAEVHVARDMRLGRTVAIKIMRSDLTNDEIFLSRFRREAHSVAQLNNPNIVSIYDSGEETLTDEAGHNERVPYLVMEFVKGQTLRDVLRANGALSQRDAEQVMLGVLNALEYSHRMGIIHRDIKPGNIMISDQGTVKVMDFGIARALDDSAATMTQSQGVVGTAQYLSPEQARGETVDVRSDLYSAGCVLYEMITGRPPFVGDSAVAIAYQHVSEVATPPSNIVPGLPKMWDSICAKAMAKDRRNRYTTAAEFKNDVLTFMNGGTPVAAAFNPLTDLSNMQARKNAEQGTATVAMTPQTDTVSATQAFNPVTGQFEAVPSANGTESRAAQRAAQEKKKRKKRAIIITVIAFLALIGIAAGVWAVSNQETNEKVTVPTITSQMSEARAKELIESAGLKFQQKQDTSSDQAEGTFTKQNPAGGKQVAKGSTVTVWFSAGPQSVQVPDVSGSTQEEARQTLEDAGFKVSSSASVEDSATIAKDHVTRTDPAAGKSLEKGGSILLYISSGMTQVPNDLVGKSQDDVTKLIQDEGLRIGSITQENSDTVPSGSVTRTDPQSGTSVEQGTTVNVYVSNGKQQISVSDYTGMTLSAAKAALDGKLTVKVSGPNTDKAKVTSQDLQAGSQADKGATITLTTSPDSSGLTKVIGSTVQQAEATLKTYGYTNFTTQSQDTSDPSQAGKVLSATPDSNNNVTLYVGASSDDSSDSSGN
ncbi:Stk1 family PASTA domain-containing Ser/Thr kinase [Bifidobacterium aquikefiri]|uniref:Stk1 family PASTA domain-containing Ser/Thr kinase n=1 Tax=Bifidobacterium aquikefiri TaxID=1653207 RepID=UPI0039EC6F12